MFERLTEAARQTLVSAQEEARSLGHGYIGTEHITLGLLLQTGGPVATVLAEVGIDHQGFRSAVEQAVGHGPRPDDATALKAIGIDLDAVRASIEDSFGPGALERARLRRRRGPCRDTGSAAPGVPFTPRAKKALELALREALHFKHQWIGPEHILLGVLREGDGLGAEIIVGRGVSLPDVRQRVITALGQVA